MEKNGFSVTPSSGSGDKQLVVTASNASTKRETQFNIVGGGLKKTFDCKQDGITSYTSFIDISLPFGDAVNSYGFINGYDANCDIMFDNSGIDGVDEDITVYCRLEDFDVNKSLQDFTIFLDTSVGNIPSNIVEDIQNCNDIITINVNDKFQDVNFTPIKGSYIVNSYDTEYSVVCMYYSVPEFITNDKYYTIMESIIKQKEGTIFVLLMNSDKTIRVTFFIDIIPT